MVTQKGSPESGVQEQKRRARAKDGNAKSLTRERRARAKDGNANRLTRERHARAKETCKSKRW